MIGCFESVVLAFGCGRHTVADATVGIGTHYHQIVNVVFNRADKVKRIYLYAESDSLNQFRMSLVRNITAPGTCVSFRVDEPFVAGL